MLCGRALRLECLSSAAQRALAADRAVMTFNPANPKKTSYQATENGHPSRFSWRLYLQMPPPVLLYPPPTTVSMPTRITGPILMFFKINAKTNGSETKEIYPFR